MNKDFVIVKSIDGNDYIIGKAHIVYVLHDDDKSIIGLRHSELPTLVTALSLQELQQLLAQ